MEAAKDWPERRLRRYVTIAGRIWPDDIRVRVARRELDARQVVTEAERACSDATS